jgi:hypothetical protein
MILKIAFLMICGCSISFAQNPAVIKNKHREDVIIEELWRGYSWSNDKRRTLTYDSAGNCISEMLERWNGSKWVKNL